MTFLCQRLALGKGPERGLLQVGWTLKSLEQQGFALWLVCWGVEISFLSEPSFVSVCPLLGSVWQFVVPSSHLSG